MCSECIEITELNVTKAINTLNAQIEKLKSEQESQRNILDVIMRRIDQSTWGRSYGRSCAETTAVFKHSGVFEILIPSFRNQPFKVACDAETREGGWTILLRRTDGSENFYRNWTDYKNGFGNIEGEFFLGLDKIHALTTDQSQELIVLLEDFTGDVRYEIYTEFAIGDELESYVLNKLGNATGTAGDSFKYHLNRKFTTFDRDHDTDKTRNCAEAFTGAWWHGACHDCQLTGTYNDTTYGKGINWVTFRGRENSLKRAVMMIRPRDR
ncbi:hypothetical protein ACLKA6_016854 [Drosophila palustris]